MALGASPLSLNGICFRFRMMSVASSTTPGIDWNSCSTPSIFTAVTAAPSIELSSTRRRALPTVVPKPRSNGCAQNMPYLSVRLEVSVARRFGFLKPFQSMCFSFGRSPQSRLPESVRIQVKRQQRLVWLEIKDLTTSYPKDTKFHEGNLHHDNTKFQDVLRVPSCPSWLKLLFAVQLNNQLLVHRQLNIFALG